MGIQMFNGWYFLALILSIGCFLGLFFLLRKRSQKTQKIVLASLLFFALALHFLKFLIPPYSTDNSRLLRDSWFINICGANIFLFPFIFLSKSKKLKDYMFYIGLISGLVSIIYPMEPMLKVDQASEWLDIVRFYIHHNLIWQVPLLMVLFKIHTLSYKRVVFVPICFLGVLMFIMVNQILQSELGFIGLRGDNITEIPYKNTSLIWGPEGNSFEIVLTAVCPSFFKTIPVGEFAGQEKYWPWFWLIVPSFLYLIPITFLICMIFDHKNFKNDCVFVFDKIKQNYQNFKQKRQLKKEKKNKIKEEKPKKANINN